MFLKSFYHGSYTKFGIKYINFETISGSVFHHWYNEVCLWAATYNESLTIKLKFKENNTPWHGSSGLSLIKELFNSEPLFTLQNKNKIYNSEPFNRVKLILVANPFIISPHQLLITIEIQTKC